MNYLDTVYKNIDELLSVPNLGKTHFTSFDGSKEFSNCFGTTLFVCDTDHYAKKIFKNIPQHHNYLISKRDHVAIPRVVKKNPRPGFVGRSIFNKVLDEYFIKVNEFVPGTVLCFNNRDFSDNPRHSAIYLGTNSIFHQKNYGLEFELASLDAVLDYKNLKSLNIYMRK